MAPCNFYAVAKGHSSGIFTSWEGPGGARAATDGFSRVKHKGFKTEQEARKWLDNTVVVEKTQLPDATAGRGDDQATAVPESQHRDRQHMLEKQQWGMSCAGIIGGLTALAAIVATFMLA